MRSLLLNVPVYAVSAPLLPISKLVASLRSKGVSNIAQADLNLSCLEYFARPEVYTEVLDTLEREVATGQTKQREGRPRLEDVIVAGRSVEGEVEQAFEVFRSPDRFSDWSSHRRALTVYRVFNLVLDTAFRLEWSWTASGDDLEAIDTFSKLRDFQDAERNPFRRYFEYELRRGLIDDETGVVGISVLYQQQLFPAFTLAKLIRERYPHVTIVFGGSMISLLEQYILRMKTFFEYAHAYVLYEGEGPLHALIESVEAGRGIPNVMNIVRLERDRIVGDRDIKAFPFEYVTPSFDGLPLDRYLSPRLILPVICTSNCYYAKCSFCSHIRGRAPYSHTSVDQIVQMLAELSDRYGAKDFYFCDNALPPALIKGLSRRLLDSGTEYGWYGDMIVSPQLQLEDLRLARRAGLKMVYVGYESFNERVLRILRKYQDQAQMLEFWDRLQRAGIASKVNIITRNPTETKDDILETLQAVLDHSSSVDMPAIGQLVVEEGTPMYDSPQEFHIDEIVRDHPEDSFQFRWKTRWVTDASEDWVAGEIRRVNDRLDNEAYTNRLLQMRPMGRDAHYLLLDYAQDDEFYSARAN
jgi:radical SAM superfamily enzyme YgiQ (UPF0313 family)